MPHPNRHFKDEIYGQFARIGKAISAPKRLEILDLLGQGPRTVEVLAKEAASTVGNTSRHLQVLRQARLVEADKKGLYVHYRLASPSVAEFYLRLRTLGEGQLAEVAAITQRFMQGKVGLEPVDRKALARRVKDGSTVLLDVRPIEEFKAGHILGARHVSLKDLKAKLAELPKNTDIVAYCRGPYCVLAVEAVLLLRQEGYRAARLEDSVLDWKNRGLPVVQAA